MLYPGLELTNFEGPKLLFDSIVMHVLTNVTNNYICQECTQPLSLYRSLKWWNMVPIGIRWFITRSGPCATAHLEAGGFIRSREGIPYPNIQYHFLPSAFKDHGRITVEKEAFQVSVYPANITAINDLEVLSECDYPCGSNMKMERLILFLQGRIASPMR